MRKHTLKPVDGLSAWTLWGLAIISLGSCAGPTIESRRSLATFKRCESYLSRPNILEVQAKPHSDLRRPWNLMKPAHIEAVAEILEMYPTQEIYFLARDAELLYDLARLATQDEPKQSKRIHLLNISRANMRADHVKDYLEQEGINERELKSGKGVLFVDTGFSGTIPAAIAENFPKDLKKHLQTHLICSSNPKHPSTRTFLQHLNPATVDSDPSGFHGTIVSYEHLPRYTDRSDRFEMRKQWEPMSCVGSQSDGSVSKSMAQAYMEDLKFYAESAEAQALMKKQRTRWRGLMTLLREHSSTEEVEAALKTLLADKDRHSEAIVRDFIEILQRNHSDSLKQIALSPENLGLKVVKSGDKGNKLELIAKFPQWKFILEDPQTGMTKLVETADFQTLRSILDVIDDYEVINIAFRELGKEKYYSNPESLKEIKRTIEGAVEKAKVLNQIAKEVFQTAHATKWTGEFKDELQELVSKLEPTNRKLSSALLADHDYPFGDPKIEDPKIKYTRLTEDERQRLATHPEQSTLFKKVLPWTRAKPARALLDKSFERAWIDPRGLIWGDVIRYKDGSEYKMHFDSANASCRKIGARVATKKEWMALSKDMGFFSAAGYIPRYLPNLFQRVFWSSSHPPYNLYSAYSFNGNVGRVAPTYREIQLLVRCVVDVRARM